MSVEITSSVEGFVTLNANVRLHLNLLKYQFTCVQYTHRSVSEPVSSQIPWLPECSSTMIALERLFAGVNSLKMHLFYTLLSHTSQLI